MRAYLPTAGRLERCRSAADRASRARARAERRSPHGHRRGRWHRPGSLEGFTLGDSKRFGNVVKAADPEPPKRDSLRPERLALLRPGTHHLLESSAQCLVNEVLQACAAGLAQPVERGRHVVIKGQGCSHTSKHRSFDVLMSRWRWVKNGVRVWSKNCHALLRVVYPNPADNVLRPLSFRRRGDTQPAVS